MQRLGESWDVVEVVRSLVTEVDSLQKIVAGQEARLQVLERPAAPRPLTPAPVAAPTGAGAGVTVGDLVADEQPAAPGPEVAASRTEKPARRVKGEAAVGATDRKA